MGTEPYVSAAQIAEMFLVSQQTLANWRSAGAGPPFRKMGVRVLYRVSEVEAWLTQRTSTSATGARLSPGSGARRAR